MDYGTTAKNIANVISKHLNHLLTLSKNQLVEERIRKFQNMGVYKN
jgi:acetyl-CoA carboxylase alpha subunit